ncbi:hypothetical protein [Bifidobacterium dentium]|uniref:hypothetical protein n=1 Tax=Bifidobacterium dentium TaxID=1689 RepID=UPI001EF80E3F|nr:hypothetical protein [Bifidobacterium dentium]
MRFIGGFDGQHTSDMPLRLAYLIPQVIRKEAMHVSKIITIAFMTRTIFVQRANRGLEDLVVRILRVNVAQSRQQRSKLSKYAFAESETKVPMAQSFFNLMGEKDDSGFQMCFLHGSTPGVVSSETPHLVNGLMAQFQGGLHPAHPRNQ